MGRVQTRSGGWLLFVAGVGLGAALMAVFDPRRGPRRRAVLKDKTRSKVRQVRVRISKRSHDLGHRFKGALFEARGRLTEERVPDDILLERVRAQIGRPVSHPRALDLQVRDGTVLLAGPILRSEVDGLVDRVSRIRGVHAIHSDLEVHDSPDIPALQEPSRPPPFRH